MAYLPTDAPGLLADVAKRKEFAFGEPAAAAADWSGFVPPRPLKLPGLRLSGAQRFIGNFASPDTEYKRVLIKWRTGGGKSIAGLCITQEFVRQFRARAALGERAPTVFVISFTARETIQEDMLSYPEFGFASLSEIEELRRLRASRADPRHLAGVLSALRRRTTDRTRGGFYQFYGYKEFANRLFAITPAGAAVGLSLQTLWARGGSDISDFAGRLAAAKARGEVVVDTDFLGEMRGGFLLADEIQSTYNSLEKNNYGLAIQYVLDVLTGADAPRAAFMSATPITGAAGEIVDLLNLLVPREALVARGEPVPLRRADFFGRSADERGAMASQLRPGAIDRIARLAAGRVSFLLDADVAAYPRRIFAGEEVPGVPYLRLTLCPMSPFHERTLAHARAVKASEAAEAAEDEAGAVEPRMPGLAPGTATLYDMAFPNPAFSPDAATADPASWGLYTSLETPAALSRASDEWRTAAGVVVEKGAAAGVAAGTYVMTGAFLGPSRLAAYSAKYARLAADITAAIQAGPGKIIIYHTRVRMSGALCIQEVLRMNGIADADAAPTDTTLCGVCGIPRAAHGAAHEYTPARFTIAVGEIDHATVLRNIARFEAPTNILGASCRILVGSPTISEGYNFRGIRHLFVTSLPSDFPSLIQVFGRGSRNGSHLALSPEQRDVTYHVLVSTNRDGRPSPELQRYIDKAREYLVIQEVERALNEYAVDGFANFQRIRTALSGPDGSLVASLDGLPYTPVCPTPGRPPKLSTFYAYGHADREAALLGAICRQLFRGRPVWTYPDLLAAVRAGAVRGAEYDPALFDEGSLALALENLQRAGAIARAGMYYVAKGAGPIDVESYLRAPAVLPRLAVRVSEYMRTAKTDIVFAARLEAFARTYAEGRVPLEMSLVQYGGGFHYALLRRLITGESVLGASLDDRLRDLYRRFRIGVTVAAAAKGSRVFRGAPKRAAADSFVGYVTSDSVSLYDSVATQWYSAPHADFRIARRHRENEIVVGFVVSLGGIDENTLGALSVGARFKIRPPIQKLRASGLSDVRTLARGAVCGTRPRDELEGIARRLRDRVSRVGLAATGPRATDADASAADTNVTDIANANAANTNVTDIANASIADANAANTNVTDIANASAADTNVTDIADANDASAADGQPRLFSKLGYAARYDRAARKRFPSATELCGTICLHLLALEEAARAPADGMTAGLRWLYLFNDQPPSVSAMMGRSDI